MLIVDWKRDQKCPFCKERFAHLFSLKRHVMSIHGYQKVLREDRWIPMSGSATSSPPMSEVLTTEASGSTADDPYYGRPPSLSPAAMVRTVMATIPCTPTVTGVLETVTSVTETNVRASPSLSSITSSTSAPAYTAVEHEPVAPVTSSATVIIPVTSTTATVQNDNEQSSHSFTEEAIVDHLTRHPEEDCTAFCRQLYHSNQMSFAAANQLATDMLRIQHILARYASNLIVRRAQVAEDVTRGDPDAYLRNQLYLQTGQKL